MLFLCGQLRHGRRRSTRRCEFAGEAIARAADAGAHDARQHDRRARRADRPDRAGRNHARLPPRRWASPTSSRALADGRRRRARRAPPLRRVGAHAAGRGAAQSGERRAGRRARRGDASTSRYIGACTGAKLVDLRMAARVLEGARRSTASRCWSRRRRAATRTPRARRGHAGASSTPARSSCRTPAACAPATAARFGENEICISSTARNFKGRMGAAARRSTSPRPTPSPPRAVRGRIADPREHRCHEAGAPGCYGDNLNTDVLAPGKYMKFGIEEIARHCLESVDPAFATAVQPGDVVVARAQFRDRLVARAGAAGAQASRRRGADRASPSPGSSTATRSTSACRRSCAREAKRIRADDRLRVDAEAGRIENLTTGETIACEPIPSHLMQMIRDGGLLAAPREAARRQKRMTSARAPRSASRSCSRRACTTR